ncbi:MAG: 3-oxoacyl-[acyl-carrier-protein] reductase [Thermotogae bacterium]|jgi:3-oxoacyl-[acyl-carrier protein] reductase|nr:3-oxoacyl-[acyl-carrier-protein] reductase [Thermotogota bacterium]MCL5032087.1 3-oxoacyl-[acyl-carrier-protein] reductase [Thermotogota bacterium]
MRLEGKVTLITGAASGIGLETARIFMKAGSIIAGCDYNEESLKKAQAELGDNYKIYKMDVSKHDDVKLVVDQIVKELGRIDVLINNAGITKDNFLVRMSEADFDAVISINLKGAYNVTQAVVPHMMNQRNGVILNASSVVGIYGNIGQTNYSASKAGLIGMTKTWSKELARYNIRVNAVAPGYIRTPMTENLSEKVKDLVKEKTALGRMGEPSDVANAYLFLSSDEAGYITGQVLGIDGGLTL